MEHKSLRPHMNTLPTFETKPGISLNPWQKLAVSFLMASKAKYGFALLADEMGLGKVIPQI